MVSTDGAAMVIEVVWPGLVYVPGAMAVIAASPDVRAVVSPCVHLTRLMVVVVTSESVSVSESLRTH